MRRVSTISVQAVDVLVIVILGLAIPFVPLALIWAIDQGFSSSFALMWRVAADAWLLGHGVDIGVTLPANVVIGAGLEGAQAPFVLGLGVFGSALLSFVLAVRSGIRLRASSYRVLGLLVTAVTAALAGFIVALSARHDVATPDLLQSALLPALIITLGVGAGLLWRREAFDHARAATLLGIPTGAMRMLLLAGKAGLAAAVAVFGAASLVFTVVFAVHFLDVLSLFQGFQPTHLGALALLLLHLALLPTAIVWTASWIVGPGFAVGTGSSVTLTGVQLGPVPSIPMVGVLDGEIPGMAIALVVVPVVLAACIGWFLSTRDLRLQERWYSLIAIAFGGAIVAGAIFAALGAFASGGAGPGRLQETGVDALMFGLIGAAEVAGGLLIGLFVGQLREGAGLLGGGFTLFAGSANTEDGPLVVGGGDSRNEPALDADSEPGESVPGDSETEPGASNGPLEPAHEAVTTKADRKRQRRERRQDTAALWGRSSDPDDEFYAPDPARKRLYDAEIVERFEHKESADQSSANEHETIDLSTSGLANQAQNEPGSDELRADEDDSSNHSR
ncbi:cell division protein PerM [Humidisolicoccus flavus]|uniref:cell division protein PerM n=1 Tax=Humidisolicoccus flavus TaxID=3111414 RepID=UPI00324DA768